MQPDTQTKVITCIQCDCEFDYTIDEQMYYQLRGFDEPKRCPACRKKKSKPLYLQPIRKDTIKKKYHHKDLY
ncbi:MAG: zinc-ribbon domain containing protein [Deltaproteobacteria bacterium]|nr:MAG: zinc-ribbon domain containing protein [Deltaproteobacteria bacterium]